VLARERSYSSVFSVVTRQFIRAREPPAATRPLTRVRLLPFNQSVNQPKQINFTKYILHTWLGYIRNKKNCKNVRDVLCFVLHIATSRSTKNVYNSKTFLGNVLNQKIFDVVTLQQLNIKIFVVTISAFLHRPIPKTDILQYTANKCQRQIRFSCIGSNFSPVINVVCHSLILVQIRPDKLSALLLLLLLFF